jgi:hypothetical protein
VRLFCGYKCSDTRLILSGQCKWVGGQDVGADKNKLVEGQAFAVVVGLCRTAVGVH